MSCFNTLTITLPDKVAGEAVGEYLAAQNDLQIDRQGKKFVIEFDSHDFPKDRLEEMVQAIRDFVEAFRCHSAHEEYGSADYSLTDGQLVETLRPYAGLEDDDDELQAQLRREREEFLQHDWGKQFKSFIEQRDRHYDQVLATLGQDSFLGIPRRSLLKGGKPLIYFVEGMRLARDSDDAVNTFQFECSFSTPGLKQARRMLVEHLETLRIEPSTKTQSEDQLRHRWVSVGVVVKVALEARSGGVEFSLRAQRLSPRLFDLPPEMFIANALLHGKAMAPEHWMMYYDKCERRNDIKLARVMCDCLERAKPPGYRDRIIELLQAGIDQGDQPCQLKLAYLYWDGTLDTRNYDQAMRYLKPLADAGDATAVRMIGRIEKAREGNV